MSFSGMKKRKLFRSQIYFFKATYEDFYLYIHTQNMNDHLFYPTEQKSGF